MDDSAQYLPFDFPPIQVGNEQLATFNKVKGAYQRQAHYESKPKKCILCGQPKTSFCNSHSIPQLCLRRIAVDGEVLSFSSAIGTNLLKERVGINQAGTFRIICNDCDNTYFKDYESPETWTSTPSQKVMGQIATKICLSELARAREQIPQLLHLGDDFDSEDFIERASVRNIDMKDDYRNLELAMRATEKRARVLKPILFERLPYIAPIAFQIMVNPIADCEGSLINDLLNPDPSYDIEPLYVCVFPMAMETLVLVFRNRKATRYRMLESQLSCQEKSEALQSILRMSIAYSDQIFFSPKIENVLKNSEGIASLARMNIDSLVSSDQVMSMQSAKHRARSAGRERYAISRLPEIPHLFEPRYAIGAECDE